MRQLTAFTKKELMQQARSGKILILGILFCLFGIMNPAISKMTPWLLEIMSEDLAESGFVVGTITVDALTSWTQFFKNMPLALIVFILMFSGNLTDEFQNGTLINVLTKGLKRPNIIIPKIGVAIALWTIGYFLSFGITYGYNAYFWDNAIAQNLFFSVFSFYIVGVWLITVIYLASSFFKASSAVTLTVGIAFGGSYLLGLIAKLKEYVPTFLMNSGEMLLGKTDIGRYLTAIIITAALILLNIVLSVVIFNRKHM